MKLLRNLTERYIFLWIIFIFFILPFYSHAQSHQGKLAIIIDDIGYNLQHGRKIAELPIPITLAVLPFTPHGKFLAELGHQQGKEIMLHTPMSNEHQLPLGPGALTNEVSQSLLVNILDQNLTNIPHVKGVNNHMGSQLTQNAEVMGWLMSYLKSRQLYFVDSRTTHKTQALNQAKAHHLPSRKRDVFLDDIRNITHIRKQLRIAIELAKTQDGTIAIGHPYPETLAVLTDLIENHDSIELVRVSQLLSEMKQEISQPPYCPLDIQFDPPISFPFVTEDYLNLPIPSHKKSDFVIKTI